MKIALSSLSICGLILILLPLTFSTSPARSRARISPSYCPTKNASTSVWTRIVCGLPNNRSFKRKVLLYSRASHLHVQIKKTELDARGGEGSDYARLVLESDNFGSVQIRGEKTKRYLCMNKKGELVARVKKQRFAKMKRCSFREEYTAEGYFQYRSVKYNDWFIGFSKGGRPSNGSKSARRPKYCGFTIRELPEKRKRRQNRKDAKLRMKIIRLLRKKLRLR